MKWILAILIALPSGLSAQIGTYVFSTPAGTFSYLSSYTSATLTGNVDDGYNNGISIGFTFNYCGSNYTTVNGCTNGFLSFNALSATYAGNGSTGSLATGTNRPALAPLWEDIQVADLRYATSGSAPNRIFTMEWNNCNWNWSGTTAISIQVKLYETTNVIDFIYKQEAGAIVTSSGGASVGISATATGSGNYWSLPDLGATPTPSSSTDVTTLLTKPATNQVYRWTPSSCTTPTTQATSFSTNTITNTTMNYAFTRGNGTGGVMVVCKAGSAPTDPTSGTTYTASATYGSGAACGGGFVVYNGTASGINSATGNIALSGLTSATTYYFAVYEYNSSGTCYHLTELTGTGTTTGSFSYCTPTYSAGCENTVDMISRVQFVTIDNSTTNNATCATRYNYFSEIAAPNIIQGVSYNLLVTVGNDGGNYTAAWFDFNNDGDFTDAGEYFNGGNPGANSTATIPISVPAGANVGTIRMRIRGGEDSDINLQSYACGASPSGYGEAEDYDVIILASGGSTPVIVLSDNGTQVAAANVNGGTLDHVLHKFRLAVSTANATLTNVSCTTTGTSSLNDVRNLQIRYSTDATLDAGDARLGFLANPGTAGAKTFPNFISQVISSGSTGYIFITAEIKVTALIGNTIAVNNITAGNLTFVSSSISGSTTSGGTQTFTSAYSNKTFSLTYGTASAEEAHDAIQTADGGYLLTGWASSKGYVVKTDNSGVFSWGNTYGTVNGENLAKGKEVSNGGGYILVGNSTDIAFSPTSSDGLIVRINQSGNHLWSTTTFGSYRWQSLFDITEITNGFAASGTNSSRITNNQPNPTGTNPTIGHKPWVLKTNTNGVVRWSKTGGLSARNDMSYGFAPLADGSFIQAGKVDVNPTPGLTLIKYTSTGDFVWGKHYVTTTEPLGGTGTVSWVVNPTADGGYIMGSSQSDFSSGGNDITIIKTNSTGVASWISTYGGAADDICKFVSQTPDGGYVLGGYTSSYGAGNNDGLLIKINSTGTVQWSKTFGGASDDQLHSLEINAYGGFIMGGITASKGSGSTDMWLISTDSNGDNSGCDASQTISPVSRTLTETTTGGSTRYNGHSSTPATVVTTQAATKTIDCDIVVLPVELLGFNIRCEKNSVLLTWKTAMEQNNNYFTVERSSDGQHFYKIGTENGAGNSNSVLSYSFLDKEPLSGTSYYKLSQTDYNGESETFLPLSVNCEEQEGNGFSVAVNPNLIHDGNVFVSISGAADERVLVVMTDILGRELYSVMLIENADSYLHSINFGTDILPGLYFITASSKDEYMSKKIVVR